MEYNVFFALFRPVRRGKTFPLRLVRRIIYIILNRKGARRLLPIGNIIQQNI